MKFQSSVLKDELFKFVEGSFSLNKISNSIITIQIPETLDIGAIVEVKVKIEPYKITLYNNLYQEVVNSLEKELTEKFKLKNKYLDIEKKYLKNKNINDLNKILLEPQNIEHTTLLKEKVIRYNTYEEQLNYFELAKNILNYANIIKMYYNNVFHTTIATCRKKEKKNIFNEAVKKYLFRVLKEENMEKIEKENIYSKNVDYYKIGDVIIGANNSKIHFMESLLDLEKLQKNHKYKNSILVINITEKSDLNLEYIEHFKEKLSELNTQIEKVSITDESDIMPKMEKIDSIVAGEF